MRRDKMRVVRPGAGRPLSARAMQALDRRASREFGIPSIVLMENAGRGAAEHIIRILRRRQDPRVIVVCGPGNNGGDGYVVARHLYLHGILVEVLCVAPVSQLKGDARVNAEMVQRSKIPCGCVGEVSDVVRRQISSADLVVDALFGIGLSRPLEAPFVDVIEAINSNARRVVALDVPSGLDATTGRVWGACVKADWTVTFQQPKTGLARGQGPVVAGRVLVSHIGIHLTS